MLAAGRLDDDSDREDHFSSGSSSSSSDSTRSITPLSDTSNEASYTASVNTDHDDDQGA